MLDDFNTPVCIANLFELCKHINSVADNKASVSKEDKQYLQENFNTLFFDVLGLKEDNDASDTKIIEGLMSLIMEMRKTAREQKDYVTSDKIRDALKTIGIEIKDSKNGVEWRLL